MHGDDASALGAVADMMQRTHMVGAHELPALVVSCGHRLGFGHVEIYLVDLQQRHLLAFDGRAEPDQVLDVDASVAGHCFQRTEIVSGDAGDGRTMWVPLLDGSERLGVLALRLPAEERSGMEPTQTGRARLLASLVAELVMTKTLYGDTIVRHRRTQEMSLAAEMQWSLLPPLTFVNRDVSVAAALEPAYDVAGDSVDYAVDGDVARFAVFDGMGHGLTSAQLVSLTVAAYRNARRHGRTLVETAAGIEQAVAATFAGSAFTTGLVAELELASGRLSWVCAGHPPPVVLRHGRVVKTLELEPGLPFGLGDEESLGAEAASPLVGSEQLEPGDHVLLYTDGVTEARSPQGELFGLDRLTDLVVRSLASQLPAAETMRRAVHTLLEHQSARLADDATMLLVQWRPEDLDRLLP